jgi:hypothetical protein
MAARRAAARATTASDLPHHGAAYATATVRAENKTLARGTQLQVCSQLRLSLLLSLSRVIPGRVECPKRARERVCMQRRSWGQLADASAMAGGGRAACEQACMTLTEKTQHTWGHKDADGREPPYELHGTTHSELKNHGDYSKATVRATNKSLTPGTQALMTLTDHSQWGHADESARKAVRAHQTARLNTVGGRRAVVREGMCGCG